MHYFSGKGCSEFLESMHYCIGILIMIEKIIEDIVNSLVINNIISREQKEEYQYALICEIESLIIIGSKNAH